MGSAGFYGFAAEQVLQVFEQLLHHPYVELEDRTVLEQLVLLIAQQVGVPPAAIAQLATPAGLPPI